MEYTKELHETLLDDPVFASKNEILALLAEITRLQSLTQWVRYVEGDTKTYPQQEGLFNIITKSSKTIPDVNKSEFYNFYHGWATDEEVEWYQLLPQEGVK